MNLENIFDSYEEKQSDSLLIEVDRAYDADDIEYLEKKFQNIEHPNIGYILGQKWCSLSHNLKEAAFPHYINSASFGFNTENIWLNTGYSNSVALSIFHLLNKYNYKDSDNEIFMKLAANAFVLWSGLIKSMKQTAYDSLKFKGFLIEMDNLGVRKLLKDYYYDGDDICVEMLSLSDYLMASIGYNEVGENDNEQEMHENVRRAYNKILSLPQYSNMKNLSVSQVAQLSIENQKYMFDKVFKDYQNGKFEMNSTDFKEVMNDLRIKANPFFSGF